MESSKVYEMKFNKIYPALVSKASRKGKTQEEVNTIIFWLLGYDEEGLLNCIKNDVSYGLFIDDAPQFNDNAKLIKGVICGVRVENIEDEFMWKVRCLDKLIDELAKNKAMEKILRHD